MIVTIDGPAGAGKSSIARDVAHELGFEFLDTGAFYRAVTLGAIRRDLDFSDRDALIRYVRAVSLRFDGEGIWLDGECVADAIRAPVVTAAIRYLADVAEIRAELSRLQRDHVADRDVVTEGRDQGTEVFPDAECKIFLTASAEERARRRQEQLKSMGQFMELEDLLAQQNRRDQEDRTRPVGALRTAADSVMVQTDGMQPSEVVDAIVAIARRVLPERT